MARILGVGRESEFLKLWAGQTVSLLGSEITLLALPLTAILVLKTTPMELGVLSAAQSAPFLLLSLPAGVWVDRLPRRPILVASDLGRALVLGSVPLRLSPVGCTSNCSTLRPFALGPSVRSSTSRTNHFCRRWRDAFNSSSATETSTSVARWRRSSDRVRQAS